MTITVDGKDYAVTPNGIKTDKYEIVSKSVSREPLDSDSVDLKKADADPVSTRMYRGATANGQWYRSIGVPACVAEEYDKHIEVAQAERMAKIDNSIEVHLSSRGWGDYSSVKVIIDRRDNMDIWLAAAREAFVGEHDVDHPNQTDDELMDKIIDKVVAFDRRKAEVETERNEKEQRRAELMDTVSHVDVKKSTYTDEDGKQPMYTITVAFADGESYTFSDRNILDYGRCTNPCYSIADGIEPGGLVTTENGKLVFQNFEEPGGWYTVRALTEKECIAYELIRGYYGFVGSHIRM